jgi:hypothetical protein
VENHLNLVTCKKCGWVYFSYTWEDCIMSIEKFNSYYYSLPNENRTMFSGPSSIENYKTCGCGNSYKNFRDYDKKIDADINGHTISPILHYNE